MRVLMKETHKGSVDGISINEYKQGEEYELPLDLANIFLNLGVAVKVEPKIDIPPEQSSDEDKTQSKNKGKK